MEWRSEDKGTPWRLDGSCISPGRRGGEWENGTMNGEKKNWKRWKFGFPFRSRVARRSSERSLRRENLFWPADEGQGTGWMGASRGIHLVLSPIESTFRVSSFFRIPNIHFFPVHACLYAKKKKIPGRLNLHSRFDYSHASNDLAAEKNHVNSRLHKICCDLCSARCCNSRIQKRKSTAGRKKQPGRTNLFREMLFFHDERTVPYRLLMRAMVGGKLARRIVSVRVFLTAAK